MRRQGLKKMNKLQNPSGGDKGPTADRPATQAAALAEDSKQGEPVDIAAVQSEAVVEDTRQGSPPLMRCCPTLVEYIIFA